jgi:threonine dehydrogenase-like Zn-dependent dehydrogenase
MKALFFDKKVTLIEIPKPKPEENEALIRVLRAGICQTDLEILKGYMNFKGILGHEFVGIVEASLSSSLQGKRVAGEINIGCNRCFWCLTNASRHCPDRKVLGISNKDGVFAEYVTLPERNLHLLPDTISNDEAIFVEPLAAAVEIEEQVHIKHEDSVLIIGDGRLGQLIAQLVHLKGCPLLVMGKNKNKLAMLSKFGIDTVNAPEKIEQKFDIIIECSGSREGLKIALNLIKPRGKIVLKSTIANKYSINLAELVINEIELIGSRCGPFEPAIRLLSCGFIKVQPLISACFPLEQGLKALNFAKQKNVIKVILTMEG